MLQTVHFELYNTHSSALDKAVAASIVPVEALRDPAASQAPSPAPSADDPYCSKTATIETYRHSPASSQ